MLAELGACVKKPESKGFMPVHVAAQNGHAEVIRLLARLKADVTTTTNRGSTPLKFSAKGAHFEATKALLLLGAPVAITDLKQYSDAAGDTRQLRADLQAWAADALAQHRIFTSTFLFGCSVHPQDTTVERTVSEISLPHPVPFFPPITNEAAPVRITDNTGAKVVITTVTTVTHATVTTVITTARTTNPVLRMLEGEVELRAQVAEFVGVVVGRELRHTRAMGPAIAAVDWAAPDQA